MDLELYVRPGGDCPTKEFLGSLTEGDRIKVTSWLKLLKDQGYLLHRPYCDTARGKIKYLRVRKGTMVYRIFYFFYKDKIITVNGYVKKKDALDQEEIARAERLMHEYIHG